MNDMHEMRRWPQSGPDKVALRGRSSSGFGRSSRPPIPILYYTMTCYNIL